MNKKIILFLIIIILLAPLSYTYGEKQLVIAGDKNNPPYEYIDDNGDYIGFNIDILKAISLEMGKEFKLLPMDWMEAHKKLLDGDIDAIQGMSFNEERKKIYSFSDSYLEDELLFFTLSENADIHSLNNLKGKKVSVQRHSLGAYILSDLGEIEIDFTDNLDESFMALKENKIDGVLANKATALNTIKNLNMQNDIKILADKIASTPYGIAFNKDNDQYIDEFNIALRNIKNNGTYQRIYDKWFGEVPDLLQERYKNAITILFLILSFIIIIILLIIRFNSSLKSLVSDRTKEIEDNRKELLESYIYRDQIINSMGSGIIILDTNEKIVDINPQAENLLSIKLGNEMELNYLDSSIIKFFDKEIIGSTIKNQTKYNSLEKEIVINGKELIYAYDIYPFLDYEDNNIGTLILVKDLTEITKLRRTLVQKDKLESLGLLVSSIAHEIRNPLTAIKSYIDILPVKYDNPRFRDKITEQLPIEINRLNDLLTDLLEYSKPKKFKKEVWNLKDKLKEALGFLDSNIRKKNIKVNLNIDDDINIYSDRYQIRQVIINIILNSIDALDENGSINIYSKVFDNSIVLSIEDNGKGIEKVDLEYIFDPFYTSKDTGTGLGLATAYSIMKENNGFIEAKILDKGTKINLVFERNIKEEINLE